MNPSTILKALENFSEEEILDTSTDQRKPKCLLKNINVSNFISYTWDLLSSFELKEIVAIDEKQKFSKNINSQGLLSTIIHCIWQ